MTARSEVLAARLEAGAGALARYAAALTEAEWRLRIPHDGRPVGVVVHHVATMYPLEVQLAQVLADGKPIETVTWDAVHALNAEHAETNAGVDKETALAALKTNSASAAAAVRGLTDEQLDRAAPVSLNANAPLTCQFFVEDHALRHSYHHLAKIQATVESARRGA
jgi:DinB family protein